MPTVREKAVPTTAAKASGAAPAVRYWVVGGTYTGTDFAHTTGGGPEERIGPFETYKAALDEWSRLAWRSVDDCHARYRIEAEAVASE